MKKIFIVLSVLILNVGFTDSVSAQNVNINVNINIDKQPAWGPIGYEYVQFYYFPDINVYYDVVNGLFYYPSRRSTWTPSRYLPNNYRRYDLYGLYKVVINQPQPWLYNRSHRKTYSMYKGDRTQTAIRYSNDSRYNTSRSNNVRWTQPSEQNTQPQTNNGSSTSGRRQDAQPQTNSGNTNSGRRQNTTQSSSTNNSSRNENKNSQSTQNNRNNPKNTSSETTTNRRR